RGGATALMEDERARTHAPEAVVDAGRAQRARGAPEPGATRALAATLLSCCCCCCKYWATTRVRSTANCLTTRFEEPASAFKRRVTFSISRKRKSASK